jgi:hypothetical protein
MVKHCLICGCPHEETEHCPPQNFVLWRCSCGNETVIPVDAAMLGMKGCMCGQCNKDTDWKESEVTVEDLKRHWVDYGK